MSDEEVTPRSKDMELLKSLLDSKSQSTISQSSLSSSESFTQRSSSTSATSSSSMDSNHKKSSDRNSDSDVSHESKSGSRQTHKDSHSDDYYSDSSDTVVLEDSMKSKKSKRRNKKKHSSSETDSRSQSEEDDKSKPSDRSKVPDDNDRYLTQRNRKFYSIEETEAKLYKDHKHYDNQRDRPKSAEVLYIENHDEHYEKFKSKRRSQRPMSASSRLSSSESYDTTERRSRRKLHQYKPNKQMIYNAWEESVNDTLCQKYTELKDLLLHSLDIMQSIPNKSELLYDQKYNAAKKIIKKTLYVPNTVSMSPRDVPSYFRKSAKGRSPDSTRNSNSIYRNDSESPRSDASYSSNYDNESVVSSNSHYSRVSASTDTSTLRGSKRVTFADDGGSLCSFDQSVASDNENQIRGILKHKNKSNRRCLPHREIEHFTRPSQERSRRSRREQLSMDDNSMIRSVSEEHLNRSHDRRISRSQSSNNLDNVDNSFGTLRNHSPKRTKSPSRSTSLNSLNSSFDGSDYQLKATDNPAVKKWLREKNREHKRQIKQERLQKMNEQKLEDDQRKAKDIRTLESQIQFHKWLNNKQKELRIQKRHERIKPKPVEVVTPRKNTSPSGLRPASLYSGFAPKAPRAKKSGLPKKSKKKQKEEEKMKAAEETLKKRISYETWLKQKQEDEAKQRRSAEKLYEKLSKSADEDTKRVIADAAKRRFERVVDGKKTLDSGLKKSNDDTRPTSAPPTRDTSEGKYKWANESTKNSDRPHSARPPSPNKADRISTSSQNPFKIPTPPTENRKANSRRPRNSGMYYKPRDFNDFLHEEASGVRPEPQGCDAPNDLPVHDTASETSSTMGESKPTEKSKQKKSNSDSGSETETKLLAIKAKPDSTFLTSVEA